MEKPKPSDHPQAFVEESSHDSAFVALLTSHQQMIHGYLISLLPGDPATEDILQRANITLWKKRKDFEIGTNFRAWAFSIARWETRAWLTQQKRQDWLVFDDDLTDKLSAQFQELPYEADHGVIYSLRHCMAKLSDKQRLLLLNYYQHDKSLNECATIANRSTGSLKVTLFRIRAKLRHCMQLSINAEGVRP